MSYNHVGGKYSIFNMLIGTGMFMKLGGKVTKDSNGSKVCCLADHEATCAELLMILKHKF